MKLHILIVDDSPTLREVIKGQLKDVCQECALDAVFSEAGNGEQAEKVMQENYLLETPVDIVFLDWMMPKMTGLDFLKNLRETIIFKELPDVIMLTAETYPDQIAVCMKYNVTSYLTKPFQYNDLKDALEKIIERRKFKYAV
jgi:CheY-like chemotaxis protein